MVECEFYSKRWLAFLSIVLIDTWWNVNSIKSGGVHIDTIVLIDTWWNVNENANLAFMEIFARFNRYMVECELFIYHFYNIA